MDKKMIIKYKRNDTYFIKHLKFTNQVRTHHSEAMRESRERLSVCF